MTFQQNPPPFSLTHNTVRVCVNKKRDEIQPSAIFALISLLLGFVYLFFTTMPDLATLVNMSSLTLTRCPNNPKPAAPENRDLRHSDPAKTPKTLVIKQDESNGGGVSKIGVLRRCLKIKKSVEPKSLDDYLSDWVAKSVELGISGSKLFLPFLVGAPKLAECRVCYNVIYPGDEVLCSVRDCQGSYHLTCARNWLGLLPSSKKFKCPLHACFLCKKKFHLWRCSKCHLASHAKCAAHPKSVLRSHERREKIVCWRHATDWPPLKPAVPTDSIEEVFCRLPLPYDEEFKIDFTCKDNVENKSEPPPYVHIKRNIYLVKRKRDDTDRNVGCTDCSSSTCTEDCVCRLQCISCSKACRCSETCTNKPFRKDKKIKIVETAHCGWGVEAAESIKKGDFIIEYVGEVISDALCEQRLWDMKHRGIKNFYMCELRKDFTIDATFKGNTSRFLNHSCGPNCNLEKWEVDGETRVGVFAARSIEAGEPLTYDYRFVQFGLEVKCRCGASNCQGYLGTKKKMPKLELLDWRVKRRRTATINTRRILGPRCDV